MSVLPEGRLARLVWRADSMPPPHACIRYLSDGEVVVAQESVALVLAELVESVLTRLDERGIGQSDLKDEWLSIQSSTDDERSFSVAAARLGLDPYALESETASLIERAGTMLEEHLLEEFLDAVSPLHLDTGLTWIEESTRRISEDTWSPTTDVDRLRSAPGAHAMTEFSFPWDLGWHDARRVRSLLGVDVVQRLTLDELVSVAMGESPDRGLQAFGGRSAAGSSVLLLGVPVSGRAVRFAQARALWHFIYEPDRSRFLINAAHTVRQRVERAFAAELLATATGVASQLPDHALVTQEDIEQLADNFDVSPLVVRHQLENQLRLGVAE